MKPSPRVLLIGNGQTPPAAFLRAQAAAADVVVATDGAADKALSSGVKSQVIIGDFDSVSPRAKKQLSAATCIFVDRQDNTDLEKALTWLSAQKYTRVTLCGFTGGRLDFTIGNLLSLTPYARILQLTLTGPGWSLCPLTHRLTRPCAPGARVSLLCTAPCSGVTTSGLYYPLKNARIDAAQPGRFLSNKTTGKRFSVSLTKGVLWVYFED